MTDPIDAIQEGFAAIQTEIRLFNSKMEDIFNQLKDHEERLRVIEKYSVESLMAKIEDLETRLRTVETTQNTNKGRDSYAGFIGLAIIQLLSLGVAVYAATH